MPEKSFPRLKRIYLEPEDFDKLIMDNAGMALDAGDIDIGAFFNGFQNSPLPRLPRSALVYGRYMWGRDTHETWAVAPMALFPEMGEEDAFMKQVIAKKLDPAEEGKKGGMSGSGAWRSFEALLKKKYSPEEIEEALLSHQAEENRQIHFFWPAGLSGKCVLKFAHVAKYDANGAHADALRELFPRCSEEIEKMYREKKDHPEYKLLFNYFVGMLKHRGYDGAYWWIVKRTTDLLQRAVSEAGGILVYANTDGFACANPDKELEVSAELGGWKKEYEGPAYFYQGGNYSVYQFGEEKKGSVRNAAKPMMDLPSGKVVSYRIDRSESVRTGSLLAKMGMKGAESVYVIEKAEDIEAREVPVMEET